MISDFTVNVPRARQKEKNRNQKAWLRTLQYVTYVTKLSPSKCEFMIQKTLKPLN